MAEIEPLRVALSADPGNIEVRVRMGAALLAAARPRDALAVLVTGLRTHDAHAGLRGQLGLVCRALGRLDAAVEHLTVACRLSPDDPVPRCNLGEALLAGGDVPSALVVLKQAATLGPHIPQIHCNLSEALRRAGEIGAATAAAYRAIALDAGYAKAHNNLGMALKDQGDLPGGIAAFRRAVDLAPGYRAARGNLLFCLGYDPSTDGATLVAAYRSAGSEMAVDRPLPPPRDVPDPERLLTVGLLSPDLRDHACAFFIEPLLAGLDRRRVAIVCYAEVARPDAVTARLQDLADGWCGTVGLSDRAVAERIRADGVDVLIDCAGHTGGSRLGVLAWRPAPLQFSWLGHGGPTGLSAVDAVIADPRLAPPGSESACYGEPVERLPDVAFCYRPPATMPSPRREAQSIAGPRVFGCFSRAIRLNDAVLDAWGEILARVPGARLVLNTRAFSDPPTRALIIRRLRDRGGVDGRVDLIATMSTRATWAAYRDIDIALDPFPHNAGTTTLEALWMGVPTISLADRPPFGRFGASILGAAGLGDLVAESVSAYVDAAVGLARDRERLVELRSGLRDRVAASPLCDETGFAAAMEALWRRRWRDWCGKMGQGG